MLRVNPTWLLLSTLFLIPAAAYADGAAERVFPPGGQRGTTLTLTFPGMEKVDSATLLVDGAGLKPLGPFLKGVGKVEIAADAAPGVRQVRLIGPKTATQPRPFAVGTLPEVLEVEPNDTFEKAQRLEHLPLTLNGSIPKSGDVDIYRVSLKKGDFLVAASESRRLAGPVYLALYVRDPQGHSIPVDVDNRKIDPVFTCAIPADGDYFIELCDVTSNMGTIDESCQYRVHLTTGPWLDYASPPSATRGTTAHLSLHGYNLEGKTGPGVLTLDQAIPANAGERFSFSASGAPNSLELLTTSQAEGAEAEPNDTPDHAQELQLPAAIHGDFGRRGDVDRFRFTAKAKETLLIDVDARELGSLADPQFVLLDAAGKMVLSVDDAEGSRDPKAVWTVPADGTYTVVLRDLAGASRGGPSSYYRLSIGAAKPEISLLAKEPALVLKPGAKAEWNVVVYQAFQPQPLTLRVEGLPSGVTAEPAKVNPHPATYTNQTQVKITLTAAAGAAPGSTPVRIVAVGADGAPVAEAVWMLTGDGNQPLGSGSTHQLLVLVPTP